MKTARTKAQRDAKHVPAGALYAFRADGDLWVATSDSSDGDLCLDEDGGLAEPVDPYVAMYEAIPAIVLPDGRVI